MAGTESRRSAAAASPQACGGHAADTENAYGGDRPKVNLLFNGQALDQIW
jgi:hypothetical protein